MPRQSAVWVDGVLASRTAPARRSSGSARVVCSRSRPGGWVAVRLGRVQRRPHALWVGIATGLSTVLLVLALADQFAGDAADPRSVYVALGIQEPAAPTAADIGVPVTTPAEDAAESPAAGLARSRALQAVGYGMVVVILHLVAGGLGGILGVSQPLGTDRGRA